MSKNRKNLEKLVISCGETLKSASFAIGRNHSYLFQYINKGSPRVFPEKERTLLADFLSITEDELRDVLDDGQDGGFSDKGRLGFRHIQKSSSAPVTKAAAEEAASKVAKMMVRGTKFEGDEDFFQELEWEVYKEMWSSLNIDLEFEVIDGIFNRQVSLKQR